MDRPSSSRGPTRSVLPTTHWSEIVLARDQDPRVRLKGLEQVLRRYRSALVIYVRTIKRMPLERAEDIVQGFIADKIVQDQFLAHVDQSRGHFRPFLLRSLQNYILNTIRSERTQRRGGDHRRVDLEIVLPQAVSAGVDSFDLAWVRELIVETLGRMEASYAGSGREYIWGIFHARIVGPLWEGGEQMEYADLVQRFGLESPAQAFNALATAKRLFERLLREVISDYSIGDDVEEEIRWLRSAIA